MSEPISLAEVERQFRDPPARYGPVDCWWWEAARLDRARLREQLESLKEQGVSGTWFYPRWVGGEPLRSDPPYWSEEWWDLTRFSLDEHERLGLISWFSDWTAHGEFQSRVREESLGPRPEFGGRRLVLYEKRTTIGGPEREGVQDWEKIQHSEPRGPVQIEVPVDEEILHAAAYRPAGGGIDQGTRVPLEQACSGNRLRWLPPGHDDWIVAVVTAQPHDLDYLNPAVADRWIELLLGRYERELPGHVGSTLQAYGPDEMYVLNGNILYSGGVVERLRAQKGYDPLPLLAGLFLRHRQGDRAHPLRLPRNHGRPARRELLPPRRRPPARPRHALHHHSHLGPGRPDRTDLPLRRLLPHDAPLRRHRERGPARLRGAPAPLPRLEVLQLHRPPEPARAGDGLRLLELGMGG